MTQTEYLDILFNDLGFNRTQRNAFCALRVNRPIKFLDELSSKERSEMIDELKQMKEDKKG